MDELDGLLHRRPAAVHRPDLHHLLVARRRLDHLAAFPHGVRRRLLDEHVLAGLEPPDGGERVPVIGRGDDDGVDVLVVEDAAQVLHELRLERRHVREPRVVDALGREVRVDVAERLDLDVGEAREPALERVALPANADVGDDHAIVGAEDAPADLCRGAGRRAEQAPADHDSRRRRAELRPEVAPRNACSSFRSLATVTSSFSGPSISQFAGIFCRQAGYPTPRLFAGRRRGCAAGVKRPSPAAEFRSVETRRKRADEYGDSSGFRE